MSPLFITLISLLFASALIVVLGIRLTRQADKIADATGLERGFVGMLLLAVATSLPELISALTAVLWLGAPGLAFGNIFGSNVTNLAFLALLDLMVAGSLFSLASKLDSRNAVVVVMMTVLSLLVIMMPVGAARSIVTALSSLAIVTLYIAAVRSSFEPSEASTIGKSSGDRAPWSGFAVTALGVVLVSIWLTSICEDFAVSTGLGRTFVGALVLALVTSLPELVVSIEAVRLGSPAMAIGNLIGSCLFNVVILVICSAAQGPSTFWSCPDALACVPAAAVSVAMLTVGAAGCWARSPRVLFGRLSPVSIALVFGYLASNLAVYGR